MAATAKAAMAGGKITKGRMITDAILTLKTEVERTLRTIFRRCIQCDPNQTPVCPPCPNGQICALVPEDCNACRHMTCIAEPNGPPSSQGPSTGALAGGVIGGVIVISALLFFLWRYYSRKRRAQEVDEAWEQDIITQQKLGQPVINVMRSDAASTRTRGSVATFMTRASNIIPIIFLPNVLGGQGRSGPGSLETPVPPIPAGFRNSPRNSPLSSEGDLYFRPGSTYSATSSRPSVRDTQYTAYSRQSITPSLARSSMMSYRDDATTEPMPATTIIRAAPRMVSVRSSPLSTPEVETPPALAGSNGVKVVMPGHGSSPATGRATQVNVNRPGSRGHVSRNSKGRFPVRSNSGEVSPRGGLSIPSSGRRTPTASSPLIEMSIDSEVSDDGGDDEHARARQSLIRPQTSDAGSPSSPQRQPLGSPFFDASEMPPGSASITPLSINRPNPYAAMSSTVKASSPETSPRRGAARPFGGLGAVIEEATKKGSSNEHSAASSVIAESRRGPFGDEHSLD